MQSGTDDLLKQLIADQEGIRPEDVTLTFTREQRAWRLYPDIRYDIGSDPDKFDTPTQKFFTDQEMEALEQEVERRLRKLHLK